MGKNEFIKLEMLINHWIFNIYAIRVYKYHTMQSLSIYRMPTEEKKNNFRNISSFLRLRIIPRPDEHVKINIQRLDLLVGN